MTSISDLLTASCAGVTREEARTEFFTRSEDSRRAGLGSAVAADLGAVEGREAQKTESGEERDQRDKIEGEREIADRHLGGAGDDRQECGAARDAEAARQLLRDA